MRKNLSWILLGALLLGSCGGMISNNIRLRPATLPASGITGEIRVDSADSNPKAWTGSSWDSLVSGSVDTITTITNADTPYTALTTTQTLLADASSGVITVNLYTAVGNTGLKLRIKKTDSSTNAITIDGATTETIDGNLTDTLATQNEILLIQSDGSNWVIVDRYIDKSWSSYTPTGSWTTNVTYTGLKRRVGDTAFYQVKISLSGAPNATTLTVNQPTGETIDSTKVINLSDNQGVLGSATIFESGIGNKNISSVAYQSTSSVEVFGAGGSGNMSEITDVSPITFGAGDIITIEYSVAISGWGS